MFLHKLSLLALLLLAVPFSKVDDQEPRKTGRDNMPVFANLEDAWVDSVLNAMTVEEKIGQLFMVAAYSNRDEAHQEEIIRYVHHYHIGGLIFFQGTPEKQAELTALYQDTAKYPLLIGMDAEWGLGMRLENTASFPRQLMLGAIEDNRLIYSMGKEIGTELRALGVNMSFSPVVDVNNNPKNPVINDRSFGEDRMNVSVKSYAYMSGLHAAGVLSCAKHFPGHGDTDVDSHKDLPIINNDVERLDSLELFPYKYLIPRGLPSVMVAHLEIPALESRKNRPSTLSRNIVTGLLRDQLGFQGLVITDALNMEGVTKYFEPGETEVEAFLAGNDILLFPLNVPVAIQKMKSAFSSGQFTEKELDESVRRILQAKFWVRLHEKEVKDSTSLAERVSPARTDSLNRKLVEHAVTVVRNQDALIPIMDLEKRIACVTVGQLKSTPFTDMLDNYARIDHYFLDQFELNASFTGLMHTLRSYDLVIVNMQSMSRFAYKSHGISANSQAFVENILKQNDVILVLFGNPYALDKFPGNEHLVVAYDESRESQEITAQILFGARTASGFLPVSAGEYRYGEGVRTSGVDRLVYVSPQEMGLRKSDLEEVDSLILAAIRTEATPGCQVLIAKDGKVFYNEAFGHHTYDRGAREVKLSDLYDLASITKIAASTPLIMKMTEEDRIDINKSLGTYIQLPDSSNKKQLILKDILAHQSGLQAWIPFYRFTLTENGLNDAYFRKQPDEEYCLRVTDDLYMCRSYEDSIWFKIDNSELRSERNYKYSDLGFYYFKELIEDSYDKPIEELAEETLYRPLGLRTMTYLPLEKYKPERIVPTERDDEFRGKVVHGYVHDPGAAMMGGVGGHAGLFSNANDLAILMQMLMNYGEYGGKRYLDSATVAYFTSRHFKDNRRGLGFDKPDPEGKYGAACRSASDASFGHTGFTGTMAWADPETGIIFIFLSNRVHPKASNTKLITDNVRTKIHQAVYDLFYPAPDSLQKAGTDTPGIN